jgi:hypothetical protein
LDLLKRLAKPSNFVCDQPLTLVVTTPDLTPWLDTAASFAILKPPQMTLVGNISELQKTDPSLLKEVLPPVAQLLT